MSHSDSDINSNSYVVQENQAEKGVEAKLDAQESELPQINIENATDNQNLQSSDGDQSPTIKTNQNINTEGLIYKPTNNKQELIF